MTKQTAIADIAAERQRQIEVEGWTPAHDDEHNDGSLASAAGCYTEMAAAQAIDPEWASRAYGSIHSYWPWGNESWKPGDARRNLVKAGALIVAEIERLDRKEPADRHQNLRDALAQPDGFLPPDEIAALLANRDELHDALKELLQEVEDGIATCPLTRIKARAALAKLDN